ncbi:MAG: hypothetical protein WDZ82_02845 [Candidatus Paceibacterota bacterium]
MFGCDEGKRKMQGVALAVGLFVGMMMFVILSGGCTTQVGTGRMVGFEAGVGLSLGENTSLQTTSKDETESGRNITGRSPYAGKSSTDTSADGRRQAWDTRF